MTNKRKKVSRQRGTNSHGWGAKKKHRGAGHRGGRGNAGSGKRGDAKKPSYWKKRYFGKKGFIKKGIKEEINAVNVSYFEEHLKDLISRGLVKEEKGVYIVDSSKIGFNKVLGTGKITKKFKIQTKYASLNAIEKVKKAGGELITEKAD